MPPEPPQKPQTPQYLHNVDHRRPLGFFKGIFRYPLVYLPKTTAELNWARLPDRHRRQGMELAYREQFMSDARLEEETLYKGILTVVGTMFIASAVMVWVSYADTGFRAAVSGVASFVLILWFVAQRIIALRYLILALVLPPIITMLATVLGVLLLSRFWATLCTGLVALAAVAYLGREPFRFYRDWLYTHPRLKPETRKKPPSVPILPSLGTLALVLAILIFLPALSPILAFVVLYGLCFFKLGFLRGLPSGGPRPSLRTLGEEAFRVFGQYVHYGMSVEPAPGVWLPEQGRRSRLFVAVAMLAPLTLVLAVGTSGFFPTDLPAIIDPADGVVTQVLEEFSFEAEDVEGAFSEVPFRWIGEAFERLTLQWQWGYVWCFPLGLFFAFTLPPLVFLVIFQELVLWSFRLERRVETELDNDGRPEWQWYVDRMRLSPHAATNPMLESVREAEHLFLGVEPHAQFPVILDQRALQEHCYIVGETGSGKTSLGLMPLLIQLIRGHQGADGALSPLPPIVVLDLKGDPALFHTVKTEAELRAVRERRGPRESFKFFTTEQGKASYYFNPFHSLQTEGRTLIQLCHLFLDSLSLNHGEGYGRSYYSRKSRALLFRALESRHPTNFAELYDALLAERRANREEFHDAFELVSTIHALTKYPQLLGPGDAAPARAIRMDEVLDKRQIVYFWMPAAVESLSVREIGKLALFSLMTAAIDRQQRGLPPTQAYLIIDEFQRLVGENFSIILEQARSFGLSVVLANQSQQDLRTPQVDLRPAIRTNTRVKFYFSLSDPGETKDLSDASGQELTLMRNWGYTDLGQSVNYSQSLKPRLTVNDISRVSDHPLEYILHVSRGSGYTQYNGLPLEVRTTWPISRREYLARQRAPWPELKALGVQAAVEAPQSPRQVERERDEELAAQLARMEALVPEFPELAPRAAQQDSPTNRP